MLLYFRIETAISWEGMLTVPAGLQGGNLGMKALVSVLAAVFILGTCSVASAGDVTSKVDVQVWGRAKFDVHYDTANIGGYTDFATRATNMDPDDYDAEFNFNGRDTRFGFKGTLVDGEVTCGAVAELDFYGTNAGNNLIPRMRLGYVFMKKGKMDIRFGQDWIPVAAQNPATVDFGILSYGGNLWWRVPQITARYNMDGGVQVLASLMKHRIRENLVNGYPEADHQEVLPWILGRVQKTGFMDGKGLIALGGGFRSVSLDKVSAKADDDETDDFTCYLAALEFVLPVTSELLVKGEVYTGNGIGEEFLHYGFEYGADPDDGEAAAIPTMGGFVSLSYKASQKLGINVGVGMDDPDEDYGMGAYTKNMVIFANVKHSVNKHMGFGFEVMNFTTEYGEDTAGDTIEWTGQRITGSTWFVF
jgi:hypothetical protein